MQKKIIECVPNFSEGRNLDIIKQITHAIESVEGVTLLDVDPGKATNRTVVTFVGDENSVVLAAFKGIEMAAKLIDMSKHQGEHPRFGATDVCPFVPVANASMEDCIACANKLGQMVGEKLQIPVYLYESAASSPIRKNLANVRAGEYEGIAEKIKKPEWKPNYGPATFNAKNGNIAIGARDFLIAYNINLNTTSVRRANSVAFDIREQGRIEREGDPISGEIVLDADGNPKRIAGSCKSVKAIGWFIDEYGIAQVSMNITNTHDTPLHKAFDESCKSAQSRGMRVTGSELVGLVPLKSLTDAGKFFLKQQERSVGVSEEELVRLAIKTMGLDELAPFDVNKKVIEYCLKNNSKKQLVDLNLRQFANETASESPAPGGGSISAYVGALGASLGIMVANLSSHKRGWDERWIEFSDWAEKGQQIKDELLFLVDEDTNAFNKIMDAFAMPKESDEEKKARSAAIQHATLYAIEIPFKTMQASFKVFELCKQMVLEGNPNSLSDAGVGSLCARAAVLGSYQNVMINAAGIKDKSSIENLLKEADELAAKAQSQEKEIFDLVMKSM